MDLSAEFGVVGQALGALFLLIFVDWALGSISAWQGGTFKWEYVYAVIQSKGAAFLRVSILLVAGVATNWLDFNLLGMETDPFTLAAMTFGAQLAASTLASIMDNIGKRDETAPQGVSPVNVLTPPDKT
jgi:hypothetical protein